METVSRNVILDLLPAYLAGEASAESRALVEEFARHDPQIARLIRTGTLEPTATTPNVSPPDDLEVKALKRVRRSIRRQMLYVALGTASILMIPLVAMQFTNEVNWKPGDFIVMGFLLFGTGLTYVLISRMSDRTAYRIAVGLAVGTAFILTWMNLAVEGILGDHPANLMYPGVLLVGFIGAIIARLKPRGMSRALFAMALAMMLVPLIALIVGAPAFANGVVAVFVLHACYAGLFVVSALLFRRASASDPK